MRQRDGIWLLIVLAALVVAGCRSRGPSFTSSLDSSRHFTRTAHEVHVSDKRRGSSVQVARNLHMAEQALVAGDLAEAQRLVSMVLKQEPTSVGAHRVQAAIHSRRGDVARTGEQLRKAIDLAPRNAAVLNDYGLWLCEQGQAAESLAWFDRALAEVPGQSMVLANAGVCAERAGDSARAERDLRQALATDPSNVEALATLARREFRAGRAFEARAFSERRLAAAPADPQALLLASQIEEKLGDRAAAARYVARLKTEFPGAPEAQGSTTGDGGRQ